MRQIDLPSCTCGQPLHVGSIVSRSVEPEGDFEAIVVKVGSLPADPAHRSVDGVSLTRGAFTQHVGDLLHWQVEAGTPVRCGTAADIPAPCPLTAPACRAEAENRQVWESANL